MISDHLSGNKNGSLSTINIAFRQITTTGRELPTGIFLGFRAN